MRNIHFHGWLAEKYGSTLRMNVRDVGHFVRLMEANHPGFVKDIRNEEFHVVLGKNLDFGESIDDTMLPMRLGKKDLHIVPVISGHGGGRKGIFKIILGVALVATGFGLAAFGTTGFAWTMGSQAFAIGSFGVTYGQIAMFGASMILQGVSQMLTPTPKTPSYGSREAESPSFIFNGPVNTTSEGLPVPIAYGHVFTGSAVVSGGISTEQIPIDESASSKNKGAGFKEAPNTLRSKAVAKIIDVISEGPIRGEVYDKIEKSVVLDDSRLMTPEGTYNFQGVSVDFRYGYPEQDYLSATPEVESEIQVGVTIPKSLGRVVRTVTDTDVDFARVNIKLDRGLSQQNKKTGDLLPSSLEFKIEVRNQGGPWVESEYNFHYDTFEPKSYEYFVTTLDGTTKFEATLKLTLSGKRGVSVPGTMQIKYRLKDTVPYTTVPADTRNYVLTDDKVGRNVRMDVFHTFVVDNLAPGIYEVALAETHAVFSKVIALVPGSTKISGKSTSPVEFSYRVALPGDGPWDIAVSRISDDPDGVLVTNGFTWTSFTQVVDQKIQYVNTAVCGMNVDSESFGSAIPKRGYEIYGRIVRIPSNYDPETRQYTGIWDGTFTQAYTNNPAWCVLDFLTHTRYGAGIPIENIDTEALYTIARYCDEEVADGFGGTEPRFTLNIWINTQQEAYNIINMLVSVFRGMIYWGMGAVAMSQDSPRDADIIVARANAVGGEFTYEGSAINARHNVILVTWNNPELGFRPDVEVVEDNDDIVRRGRIVKDVVAVGCTSRGQAARFGKWILFTEKFETESVVYKASFDHGEIMPGHVIDLMDPTRANVDFAGRIANVSGTTITLDRDVTLQADETYELGCVDETGVVQLRTIVSGAGVYRAVEINNAFDPAPITGAMYSVYGTDVEPKKFRVITCRELEKHVFEIGCLLHEPQKYAFVEEDVQFTPRQYGAFTTGALTPPTNVRVFESLYDTNGVIHSRATISWTASSDTRVISYLVKYRIDGGSVFNYSTTELSIDLVDAQSGVYEIEVYAQAIDRSSLPATPDEPVELLGKQAPPGDVTNFTGIRTVTGVQLSWNRVVDIDVVGYTCREGRSWDDYDEQIFDKFVGTSFFVNIEDGEERTYFIKAIDSSEVFSLNAASLTAAVIAPDAPLTFQAVAQDDHILFRVTGSFSLGVKCEVREGASWELGQFVTQFSGDNSTVLWPSRTEDQVYWVKAYSQAGLYSAISRGVSTKRALWSDRNVIFEYNNRDDGGAGNYPGYTHHMEEGTGDTLVMSELSTNVYFPKGEHFFEFTLGDTYRARNWLESTLIALAGDATTWAEATFTWASPQAQVAWLPLGDLDGAYLTQYIAWKQDPLTEELYAFGFDDDTDDFRGVITADEEVSVTYDAARYSNGVFISDFTFVSYTGLSVPAEFSLKLNVRLSDNFVSSVVLLYLKNSSSGDWLELGYNQALGQFYLHGSDGEQVELEGNFEDEDFLMLGISQSADTRALFWHSTWAEGSGYKSVSLPPIDDFDEVYMYRP